jgi:hypothetical protein
LGVRLHCSSCKRLCITDDGEVTYGSARVLNAGGLWARLGCKDAPLGGLIETVGLARVGVWWALGWNIDTCSTLAGSLAVVARGTVGPGASLPALAVLPVAAVLQTEHER